MRDYTRVLSEIVRLRPHWQGVGSRRGGCRGKPGPVFRWSGEARGRVHFPMPFILSLVTRRLRPGFLPLANTPGFISIHLVIEKAYCVSFHANFQPH